MKEPQTPSLIVVANEVLKIEKILETMGVGKNTYLLMAPPYEEIVLKMNDTRSGFEMYFEQIPVDHVPDLDCFGYLFNINDVMIWYSGDCYDIPPDILEMLNDSEIDYFYQDTCKADYENNVHLSLNKLKEMVIPEQRHKVWCMHLDSAFDVNEAKNMGFNVVKNELNWEE